MKTFARITPLCIVCLLALGLSLPAMAGKIYKWVDKNGQVHFSQTPPSSSSREYDVRFAKEKAPPAQAADKAEDKAAKDGKTAKAKDKKDMTPQEKMQAIEKARQEAAKKAAEQQKKLAQRQKKCDKATNHLRNIEQGGRIYDIDSSGERRYWDDSTRASKIEEAKGYVDKWCGE